MKKKNRTVAFLGLCTSLAMILAYVEVLIGPMFPAVPGIKMGLPNIVIMFLLYRKGKASAICVSLLRIVLASLLFGNAMSFLYSLAGAILSIAVMIVLLRMNFLSSVGVSVAGGVTHNLGQVLTAMLLLDTSELGYYMVVLTITGTFAGILVGLCASVLVKKIPENLFAEKK